MHPGNQLFVRTLGEVSVSAGGEMLPLTGGREYALLVYLAWIRSRVTRESIADLLWPSGDRSRRLHSLSQLVYRLGRSLPRGILLATKSELALRSQLVTLDAYELRSAAEAGRYRDALELCTGEFLPEFVVRDAPAFDHWREQVSTELRRLTGIVLRELVPEFERTGEWVRLHGALDRLIEDNPGDLELHRRQIRALLLQGDRAEAHARHRRYAQRLATVEQRADVDQLTNEIEKYAEIPEPLRAVDPALRTRLLGRRVEQDTLRSELALALRGRSRFVEVIGTAGLGKSRLLEHFGRYCILHGVRVLAGRCHPGGRQLPYSGIESILMSLDGSDVDMLSRDQQRVLASVLPLRLGFRRARQPGPDPERQRRLLFQTVEELLRHAASRRPLAILIDDFHWADDTTATLIERVTRNLSESPVLVLVAARPDELATGTRAAEVLRDDYPARRVRLAELDEQSVRDVVADFQEAARIRLPPSHIRMITSRAAGHPLFLLELLTSAAEQSIQLQDSHLVGQHYDQDIPPNVQEYLRYRFGRLPSVANAVADGLAILGAPADHDMLRAVAAVKEEDYVMAAEQLAQTGLVSDYGPRLAFRHDLVREAAYGLMSGARRAWLHARAARALEQRGNVDVGILAAHYDSAGNRAKAFKYAEAAAKSAERMWALSEAEHFLRMALRNASGAASIASLSERLANCLLERGSYAEADQVYASLEAMPTDVWGELRRLTIRAKRLVIESMKAPLLANDWAELGRILSRAAAVGDEVERLEIIRHVLPALWDGGRVELIAEEIHAVMSRLEEAPPTPLGLQVLSTLCQILILSDGPAAGLRWANIACGRASRLGDPSVMALAYLTRALGFHYVGRSRLASEDFAAARQVIQAAQLDKYRIPLMIYSSVASADMGDYGAASKLLDDAIRITIQEGDWRNYVCAQHNRAFYAYEQGMLIEARQAANAALVRRGLGAWYNEASTWSLLGLISLDEGEHEQAAVVRERLLEGYLPRRIWGPDLSYIEIFLARMEVADGRRDLALARLSEVIAAYEHRDVFCLSRVQLEKARMLVGTDPDEARRLAREVRARGSEIGAQPLMDKAEAVLRSLRAGRAVGGGGGGGRS